MSSPGGCSPARMPVVSMRPYVPLKPTTPQHAAGDRQEPMASVSSVAQHMPLATAAADPLDEPPAIKSGFQGFLTGPKQLSSPVVPIPSVCMFVFPMMTAPASLNLVTGAAMPEMLKGGSCRNADGVEEVFYPDGNPLQKPLPSSLLYVVLGGLCAFNRTLRSDRDERVELLLETLYSLKTPCQRIDRRRPFFAQRFR